MAKIIYFEDMATSERLCFIFTQVLLLSIILVPLSLPVAFDSFCRIWILFRLLFAKASGQSEGLISSRIITSSVNYTDHSIFPTFDFVFTRISVISYLLS